MNTMREAKQAWRKGNDAGEGFGIGPVFADHETTVDEAVDALLDGPEDAKLWMPREATDEIAVVELHDGRLVGIGDANGAWAVYL